MQSNPPNKKTVLLAIVVAEVSFIGSQRGKPWHGGGGDVEMNVGNDLRFNLSEALLLG